ncbi:MAG: phosphatase PAP2 family protein [Nitrospiraceae bacterium]
MLIGSAALAGAHVGWQMALEPSARTWFSTAPCLTLQNVHALLGCGKAFSFPSNHAVNTAAAAAFFQVLYPRSGWISWPLVAAIGSRIGAHYLSDVMGGWVIGRAIGAGVAALS